MQRSFWTRSLTFVLWLLAGISGVYWGLKFVRGPAAPVSAAAAALGGSAAQIDAKALAQGLGGGLSPAINSVAANPASIPASSINSSRFNLTGVVVSRSGGARSNVALIAVDGKPARPYRVGAVLTEGVVLHSVAAGKAMLSSGQQSEPAITLELPKLNTAVVGTAVAARPPAPQPAPAPAPVGLPVLTPPPLLTLPAQAESPTPSVGSKPPRPLANRQREVGAEDRSAQQ